MRSAGLGKLGIGEVELQMNKKPRAELQIPLSHIQIPLSLGSILLQTKRPDKLEENLLGQCKTTVQICNI